MSWWGLRGAFHSSVAVISLHFKPRSQLYFTFWIFVEKHNSFSSSGTQTGGNSFFVGAYSLAPSYYTCRVVCGTHWTVWLIDTITRLLPLKGSLLCYCVIRRKNVLEYFTKTTVKPICDSLDMLVVSSEGRVANCTFCWSSVQPTISNSAALQQEWQRQYDTFSCLLSKQSDSEVGRGIQY